MAAELTNKHLDHKDAEPTSADIVLITGGTGGIGREITKRLALQGKIVVVGTRNRDSFDELSSQIQDLGGRAPSPFIGDLTRSSEVERAYEESGIKPGQTVDYYPLAAGGLDAAKMDIGKVFVGLMQKQRREGEITLDAAEDATERFRQIMTKPEVQDAASAINFTAPLTLAAELARNKNLTKNSKIIYLGSTISEYTREILEKLGDENAHLIHELYPGPEYYRTVGIYKAQGIVELERLAANLEATFYNFVAPGVADTPIGNFFNRFVPIMEEVHSIKSDELFEFPAPSASEVADAIVGEVSKEPISHKNTIFIGYHPGEITRVKPANFRTPILDLL